ncbi:MAG: thermostable hemolysin [Marinicellaceae bacterium]
MRNLQNIPTISTNTKIINCYPTIRKTRCKCKIELVNPTSHRRHDVEKFIKRSYKNNFSADLKSFFPLILTVINIEDNSIMGALGIRYANEGALFSESYLTNSIENSIFELQQSVIDRSKIIELGNFVVNSKEDIKFVIPKVSQFIKSLDVDWAVYTLTRPIKSYFNKFGIKLNYLHDANIESINSAASDWGTYYRFNPAVYYSSVKNNMNY